MPQAILRYSSNNQQSWKVPSTLSGSKVTVELWGSQGQAPTPTGGKVGGKGGYVKFDLAVNPSDTLYFNVGRQSPSSSTGGWPDGGAGPNGAGGGGGSTDCRYGGTAQANQVGVAAGGGGAGYGGGNGGAGGPNTGATGGNGGSGSTGGGGGTQSAGGAAGTSSGTNGHAGSRANGADGATDTVGGGGGGGGYYGGGGGAGPGGAPTTAPTGGGGGSNFLAASVTNTTNTQGATNPDGSTDGYVRITYLVAPNAPVVITDSGYLDFDVASAEKIDWVPDANSTQSAADIRWRQSGTTAWTTIHQANATANYSFAANTFSAYLNQQIEVQVATYDANGVVGSFSTSLYITPRTAPAAPVLSGLAAQITSNSPSYTVKGASNSQFNQYEARAVNDSAGAPGATVLSDTGAVTEQSATKSQSVNLPSYTYVNGTSYHLQARVASPAGVWSPYADSGPLAASINAPLQPTLALTPFPATGSVKVVVTNPSGGQAVSSNQLYRTDLTTGIEELIATNLPANGTKTDWNVGYTRTYRYRAVAVGSNGATTSSV